MKTLKKFAIIPAFVLGFASALAVVATAGNAGNASTAIKAEKLAPAAKTEGDGQRMSWNEFETAKSGYANAHPNATLGGSIGKSALEAVLNSMSPDNSMVSFYFGSDRDGKTYLMVLPSGTNAATGDPVIYRNTSYCPINCN